MHNEHYQQIVEENYKLVWSVVNRFSYMQYEKDDLFQSGCIGLIMASKKYDESLGYAFSTFAIPYILGEIKNYLREKNHFKVSKQTLRLSKQIKKLLGENKKLSIKQLAKELNIGYEDVLMGYNLSSQASVMSLDKEIDTNFTFADIMLSDERFTMNNDRLMLNEVYHQLPPLEKKIFYLRFYYGLTQSEVAKKLMISQSKVSRLEKQITKDLTDYYKIS